MPESERVARAAFRTRHSHVRSLKKVQGLAESGSLQRPLQGSVESCQATSVVMSQGNEVEIGHLLASHQPCPAAGIKACQQRNIIRPEDVPPLPRERRQPVSHFVRSRLDRGVGRVRQHPDESVFGDGARGPGLAARVPEPSMRCVMIQMGCVEQGDQHVNVEQVDQRLFPQLVHEVDIYPCPGSSGKHEHPVALRSRGGGCRRLQYQLRNGLPEGYSPLA